MYMNRFLIFGAFGAILAGCAQNSQKRDWFSEYGEIPTGTPVQMQYGTTPTSAVDVDTPRRMAVMLPLSGDAATAGNAIQSAIEIAVLQNAPKNLSVSFYDTAIDAPRQIATALATNPEIIIGPLFARDANMVRTQKGMETPVLSFTSDATAVGGGVMTMALMPTNSVEAIINEMAADRVDNFIIISPDNESGRLMAGVATQAAKLQQIKISGIFYYTENDTESIKNATIDATMNKARTAANTRAREILSDILTTERLTAIEKSDLTMQLEKISKTDTIGNLPYNAVLFLGSGDDTKSLASFMRYYGLGARDARFYGTAVWDGADIMYDLTMSGAKFATLPVADAEFSLLYEQVTGAQPSRLATFGFDAARMAIGMINSEKSNAAYLLDPSGYIGTDGLLRLRPNGENERALRIVQLNGTDTPREIKPAPQNFMSPIYNIEQRHISAADAMELETPGINPMDYIKIPDRLRDRYNEETYGMHLTVTPIEANTIDNVVTILPEDDSDVIVTPDFQPVNLESVNRKYIEDVEITE